MSAATGERVIRIMPAIMLVLLISSRSLVSKAAAQLDKYSKMAPFDQYLMERNAEIYSAGAERRSRFHIQRRDDPGLGTAKL